MNPAPPHPGRPFRWGFVLLFELCGMLHVITAVLAIRAGYFPEPEMLERFPDPAGRYWIATRYVMPALLLTGALGLRVGWHLARRRWSARIFGMGLAASAATWVPLEEFCLLPLLVWILTRRSYERACARREAPTPPGRTPDTPRGPGNPMHPLAAEMQARSADADYLRDLLRRLVKAPVDRQHSVILDNLHRFHGHHALIASRLGTYLVVHLRSRRRNLHCWRAFRTLVKIGATHPDATAAAIVCRGHWHRPLRQAARDYLELAATQPPAAPPADGPQDGPPREAG